MITKEWKFFKKLLSVQTVTKSFSFWITQKVYILYIFFKQKLPKIVLMLKRMIKISQIMSFKMTVKKMTVFTPLSPQKSSLEYQEEKETQPPPPPNISGSSYTKKESRGKSSKWQKGRPGKRRRCADAEDKEQVVPGRQQAQGLYMWPGNARQKVIYRAAGTCWRLNPASDKSEQIYN